MRKIYLLLPLIMLTTLAMGQNDFTFEVDMNGETVSANGVHIAGNFQAASGQAGDWDPATSELLDGDADGIYSLTVNIPAGGYEYKFINGNVWDDAEGIPVVSQVGNGNSNRYFQLMAAGYDSTGVIVFGGSVPTGFSAVKFQVIIPDGADSVAHVAGSAFSPAWSENGIPLYDQGNNTYVVTYAVADGDYSYKFLSGDAWGTDETSIPDSCSVDGNRTLTVASVDTVLAAVCFNACGPCAAASDITISVDMSLSCIEMGTEVVNLMGTLTDWGSGAAMSDDDVDGVWEITVSAQPGEYEYKFRVGGDIWEGIGNRPLTVVEDEDQVLEADCWNSTEACSVDAFAPADVTFTVNLADSTLGTGEFAWLFGDFTAPSWQDGAIQMTDNGDGTWSTTVVDYCPQEGRYKFGFGTAPNGDVWVEENAEFAQEGGCGEDNGSFPDNRVLIRNTNEAMTVCFTFNTCDDCSPACDTFLGGPWTDFNGTFGGAPVAGEDGICPINEITTFQIWASESYTVDGFTSGEEYTFSMCNGYGAWDAELTVWDDNGDLVAMLEGCSISWTADYDGTYVIGINEVGACGSESDNTNTDNGFPSLTCEGTVGVDELEQADFAIYPNPANDVINIVFDQYGQYTVRIMDISGKIIYTNVVSDDRLRIEDNIVSGVYFVQIADEFSNVVTKKLVVK